MRVRKARPKDIGAAVRLARRLGLDYPGMKADQLWVAEEAGDVKGLVALREHDGCLELCALGVDPGYRGKGAGRALVEALMAWAPGAIYLATVIPDFFGACGFVRAEPVPAVFQKRSMTSWCEGCVQELCTVMVRKKP